MPPTHKSSKSYYPQILFRDSFVENVLHFIMHKCERWWKQYVRRSKQLIMAPSSRHWIWMAPLVQNTYFVYFKPFFHYRYKFSVYRKYILQFISHIVALKRYKDWYIATRFRLRCCSVGLEVTPCEEIKRRKRLRDSKSSGSCSTCFGRRWEWAKFCRHRNRSVAVWCATVMTNGNSTIRR